MIVDTDILIWYLRGNQEAQRFLDSCEPVLLSAVTYMELVQGMRNARELQVLRRTLRQKRWQDLDRQDIGGWNGAGAAVAPRSQPSPTAEMTNGQQSANGRRRRFRWSRSVVGQRVDACHIDELSYGHCPRNRSPESLVLE